MARIGKTDPPSFVPLGVKQAAVGKTILLPSDRRINGSRRLVIKSTEMGVPIPVREWLKADPRHSRLFAPDEPKPKRKTKRKTQP